MNFKEYQKESRTTAIYPRSGDNFIYPTLGLTGEAGEVANKVKKIERDDGGMVTEEKRKELSKELGDVLWYVAQVATEFGLNLEEIAQENLEKLRIRKDKGTLLGQGDER